MSYQVLVALIGFEGRPAAQQSQLPLIIFFLKKLLTFPRKKLLATLLC